MAKQSILVLLVATWILYPGPEFLRLAEGGKRRVHISDDLNDVVDEEEDEAWKQWGKKSAGPTEQLDPPPSDLSNMNLAEIQEMMAKQQVGPVIGFVKLRLGMRRTPDTVAEIAMKWTKVLRTGGVEVNFVGVDVSTIMFTMQQGRDMAELKEFILKEPDAYEIKIGDQVYRRPGDPPLDVVFEKLQSQKENRVSHNDPVEKHKHPKDEL
ncbi:hypothetical protein K2173_013307 [Erythroxylum novogranatense]|uniref:Mesoderm development candidate 2 n=1 Tax=Erythroxylum novogranatense TaxID=1862640 RepID=A0AAV8SA21_9ROSI|nr:hypothetical protein K2173_013307 [Erythroxylum novogranatense]